MIKLYINNVNVDLDESTKVLLSKSFNDYKNPTIIKNSFTKTVSLPATKNNNKLFNNLYRGDRVTTKNTFNASKRIPFYLINEFGSLIEQGYIKLNDINISNAVKYNITLYGELGNLLYGLTYKSIDSTDKLTLADLEFDVDLGFTISRNFVSDCWLRLQNPVGKKQIGDIINFAITYDGIPDIDNFDFNKCFTTKDSSYSVSLMYLNKDGNKTQLKELPAAYDQNGNIVSETSEQAYYKLASGLWANNTVKFGLFESEKEFTPLEIKDLRSYMLRPIIKLSEIIKAIGNYLSKNYGFIIDTSDDFFKSEEYLNTWMTLNSLWELNPSIKSFDYISQQQLLKKTNDPASYLISFIKTYGLLINIDIYNNKMILSSRKNFYSDTVYNLTLDESNERTIYPLTFDKNTYTFDYAESELDIIKEYKEQYNKQYGSKIVNTGFEFDYSTTKYIENNIFKQGTDTTDFSECFTYNKVPSAIMSLYSAAQYSLFYKDESTGNISKYSNTIECIPSTDITSSTNEQTLGNRLAVDINSAVLNPFYYVDFIPRLKCCNKDNSPVDSSNILITFNGFINPNVYSLNSDQILFEGNVSDLEDTFGRGYFTLSNTIDYNFCITDDSLQGYNEGKRCYMFSPVSNDAVLTLTEMPMFSRNKYDFDYSNANYGISRNPSDWTVDNGIIYSVANGIEYEHNSEIEGGPYTNVILRAGCTYAVIYNINFSTTPVYDYIYFNDSKVKLLSKININDYNVYRNGAALYYVDSDTNVSCRMYAGRISAANSKIKLTTLKLYNLTTLNLNKTFNTAADLIPNFGITKGYSFGINKTYDFAHSEIKFSDYIIPEDNSDLYDRYWKDYIAEIYNVDNKILQATIIIDNIFTAFNKIYWYDNALWTLSEITDFDLETKKCKAKLMKIIDKNIYI